MKVEEAFDLADRIFEEHPQWGVDAKSIWHVRVHTNPPDRDLGFVLNYPEDWDALRGLLEPRREDD